MDKCSVNKRIREVETVHTVTHKTHENFGGRTRAGIANYSLKNCHSFNKHLLRTFFVLRAMLQAKNIQCSSRDLVSALKEFTSYEGDWHLIIHK